LKIKKDKQAKNWKLKKSLQKLLYKKIERTKNKKLIYLQPFKRSKKGVDN
jgi:hypothetical protein